MVFQFVASPKDALFEDNGSGYAAARGNIEHPTSNAEGRGANRRAPAPFATLIFPGMLPNCAGMKEVVHFPMCEPATSRCDRAVITSTDPIP